MDGIEEGMCGVVGDEASWRDGILALGCLIVNFRHGVFAILRHWFCPDSKLREAKGHRGYWARRGGRDSRGGRHSC